MKKLLSRPSTYLIAVILLAFVLTLTSFSLTYASGNCQTSVLPPEWCTADDGDGILAILRFIRTTLLMLVGILAVGALTFAGVLYATAGGNEEQIVRAKTMIRNTIIGLIVAAVLFSLSFLLMPGGLER